MMKLYFWIVLEIVILICSFGVVLPATISAADTLFVTLGFVYLLFFVIPLAAFYIPSKAWKALEELERKLDEEASSSVSIDPDWPNGVQPGAPRKRGSASKPVGKQ